jgi:23S rRNA pseudouridine1911/1915/1917 synthase
MMNDIENIPLSIIYEDDWLVAFDKPSGLPTQITHDRRRPDLYTIAQKQLKLRPVQPIHYLGLHHRLDVGTSGVVVMTKQKEINKDFQNLFREKKIQKTYLAHVFKNEKRSLNDIWSIENHLGFHKNSTAKKTFYTAVQAGGDFAKTDFVLISAVSDEIWLVQAQPLTGRTHQIRVHLFEDGFPLVGDRLYFDPTKDVQKRINHRAKRMMLHAWKVDFYHPRLKKNIQIISQIEFQR